MSVALDISSGTAWVISDLLKALEFLSNTIIKISTVKYENLKRY